MNRGLVMDLVFLSTLQEVSPSSSDSLKSKEFDDGEKKRKRN